MAGTGGNGGGGLTAARHLANQGWPVNILLTRDPAQYQGVPRVQLDLALDAGGKLAQNIGGVDLIVDAITGYSIRGELTGRAKELVLLANSNSAPVVSLDLPSGLDPDAEGNGLRVHSDITMTVAAIKHSLLKAAVGKLFLADIGIPRPWYRELDISQAAPRKWLQEIPTL